MSSGNLALILVTMVLLKVAFAVTAVGQNVDTFNDCEASNLPCPEMVVIPGSHPHTAVGSRDDEIGRLESEQRHLIQVSPFAIGVTEISVAQYMACVEDRGCRYPEWLEPGGQHNIKTGMGVTYKSIAEFIEKPNQPIVGISWHDASDYANWLSKKTGKAYRLPTEKEWEHAARAGSETRFWWGDEPRSGDNVMACCDGCGSERDRTGLYPVMSFQPNPFGLYNVHGNVWEWVADYFCEDYTASPKDGSAKLTPNCPKQSAPEGLKVFRGGSCYYPARQMRSAMRLRNTPKLRNMTVGFRVARSLE